MSTCNENSSEIVREISRMLASLDPATVRQTVDELGLNTTTNDTGRCPDSAKERSLSFENFEQFAISYMVSLAAKDECYLAFAACFTKADRMLQECLKKGAGDVDKVKRCVDQYAETMKKCIEEFEKCKKK